MSDKTAIEWTDATWPVVTGCEHISPGCDHCYAAKLTSGRLVLQAGHRTLTPNTDRSVRAKEALITITERKAHGHLHGPQQAFYDALMKADRHHVGIVRETLEAWRADTRQRLTDTMKVA